MPIVFLCAIALIFLMPAGGCGSESKFKQDTWMLTLSGGENDAAMAVIEGEERGIIVMGSTESYGLGNSDFWIVSLDVYGRIVWQKTIGDREADEASSMIRHGGGIVATGTTQSFGAGAEDMWVVKLDNSGEIEWQKTLGGSAHDFAHSLAESSNGEILVWGRTGSFASGLDNALLVKLDGSGRVTWQKVVGSDNFEEAVSVLESGDGGLFIAGNAGDLSDLDMWIAKLDGSDAIEWQKTFGGSGNDRAVSLIQDRDGNLIVVGITISFGAGADDVWVIKLDSVGSILWQKTIGSNDNDWAGSAVETSDRGILITGQTWSFSSGDIDVLAFIVKVDGDGNMAWQGRIGGTGIFEAYSITEGSDNLLTVVGKAAPEASGTLDMFVAKLNTDGGVLGECDLLSYINFQLIDSEAVVEDSGALVQDVDVTLQDSDAAAQESSAEAVRLCPM